MENISYDDFKKLDLRTARIISAEPVAGSDKLLRLSIDLGEEKRQLVAGIAKSYAPDKLAGKIIVVAANLEPRQLMGLASQGMLLAVMDEQGPVLLTTDNEVPPGSAVS